MSNHDSNSDTVVTSRDTTPWTERKIRRYVNVRTMSVAEIDAQREADLQDGCLESFRRINQ